MRWAGTVARMGEKRNAYRLLVGTPKGNWSLRRPRRRWVVNIRNLGEVGWGGLDWTGLGQDRDKWRALVSAVMKLRFPWNAGKLSSGLTAGGLSRSAQLHKKLFSYWAGYPKWSHPIRFSQQKPYPCYVSR
jgi:hypothetical protein